LYGILMNYLISIKYYLNSARISRRHFANIVKYLHRAVVRFPQGSQTLPVRTPRDQYRDGYEGCQTADAHWWISVQLVPSPSALCFKDDVSQFRNEQPNLRSILSETIRSVAVECSHRNLLLIFLTFWFLSAFFHSYKLH